MQEPILRRGAWWHATDDGKWLKWNQDTETWELQPMGPPSPAPPPPAPLGQVPQGPCGPRRSASRSRRSATSSRASLGGRFDQRFLVICVALLAVGCLAMTYSMVMSTFNSSPASATPTSASHSSASGAASGDKHHFINQANHVCSLANKKQHKLAKPKSQTGLAIYANKSAQIFDSAMDQIKALNAPRDGHIILRKWFDTTDAAIAATRKLSNEVSAGASVGVIHRAGAHIAALGDKSNAYATRYGLTVCADS